jgi:branched-chain amino acid transport system substrate-binding protein
MTKVRLGAALLALICSIGLLSACGSDSDETTASSAPASTESDSTGSGGNAASGEPIVVGTIGTVTGPLSWPYLPEFWEHYEAWINENGGINGHPLKIIVKDEAGDAATANKIIRELVEGEGVQAIVGELSLNPDTWGGYIADKGIPCIGCSYYTVQNVTNPDFYPTGQYSGAGFYAAVEVAKKLGKTKMANVYCAEAPSCAAVDALMKKSAEVIGGVEVVAGLKAGAAQPSFTPICLAAKNAGAEVVYLGINADTAERIITACAQQNYEPIYQTSSGSNLYNDDFEGPIEIIEIAVNSPLNFETPFTEEAREVAGDMLEGEVSNQVIGTFAGFSMFKLVAEAKDLGPGFTAAELVAGLNEVKEETLNGGAGPITYVKGQPTLLTCYFPTQRSEGEWSAPFGEEPLCPPVKEVGEVLASLE